MNLHTKESHPIFNLKLQEVTFFIFRLKIQLSSTKKIFD